MTSDVQWQNYLNDATDAILTGESVDGVRSHYGISYTDDKELINLIENLDNSFPLVEPSPQFSLLLKDELIDVERRGVVWRIRRLPARVQWAAIVTAILGGVLIVFQWFAGEGRGLHSEEHSRLPEES